VPRGTGTAPNDFLLRIVDWPEANSEYEPHVTGVSALLACGHWASPVHEASSDWDFAGEPRYCPACCHLVQMDPRLQAALCNHDDIPTEDTSRGHDPVSVTVTTKVAFYVELAYDPDRLTEAEAQRIALEGFPEVIRDGSQVVTVAFVERTHGGVDKDGVPHQPRAERPGRDKKGTR
jgi:hypothetical protein